MESPTQLTEVQQKFADFLRARRYRRTPERMAILDHVLLMEPHFVADDLHRALEDSGYHVSRTTVYSTLDLLCEAGLLRKYLFSGPEARYELPGKNHIHLICNKCGSIKEVSDTEFFSNTSAMKFGSFTPLYFSTSIYGVCRRCSKSKKKETTSKSHDKEKS